MSSPSIPEPPPIPPYVPPPVKDEKIVNTGVEYRRRLAKSSVNSTILGGKKGSDSTRKTLLGS